MINDSYITPDEADAYLQKRRDEEKQPAAEEIPQPVIDAGVEIALDLLGIAEEETNGRNS